MGAMQPKVQQGRGYTFLVVDGVVRSECAGCNKHFGPADLRVPSFRMILEMRIGRLDGSQIKAPTDLTVEDLRVFARCVRCAAEPEVSGGLYGSFVNGVDVVRGFRPLKEDPKKRKVAPLSRVFAVKPDKPMGAPVTHVCPPMPVDEERYEREQAELEHAVAHGRWPRGATLGIGGRMIAKAEAQVRLTQLIKRRAAEREAFGRHSVLAQLAQAGWRVGKLKKK